MDKFIISGIKKSPGYKQFSMDIDTWDKLSQIKDETGISMGQFVRQAVDFAIERLVIQEEE